jgi:lambda repressor-like predicted transcriptional regulator
MSKEKEIIIPPKDIMALREWVKFRLRLKGHSLKSFGRQYGIKAGTVGVVFSRPYPRMERLLADALETQPWELWPDRYGPDHKPNRPNLWYQRKSRAWKPKVKISQRGSKSKEKFKEM